MNKTLLKKRIVQNKKLISKMVKEKNDHYLIEINRIIDEVCLVVAEFKCERCGKDYDLTQHHLIQRHIKKFTNKWRYLSQRNYWANILILCRDCHVLLHKSAVKEKMKPISKKKLKQIKEKYNYERR